MSPSVGLSCAPSNGSAIIVSLTARLLERRASTDDSSRPAASCGLASIVASANHSLTKVPMCRLTAADPAAADSISFAMNTDLLSGPLPAAEVAALVQAWKAGAILKASLYRIP